MRIFVGVTDNDWCNILASQAETVSVNFWRPSGQGFKALKEGELFLFKLHAPDNFIVGGGFFTRTLRLPLTLAWQAFGRSNGAETLEDMAARVAKYKRKPYSSLEDPEITCIILSEPFYFPREDWISVPESFSSNIVVGKKYETIEAEGAALYQEVIQRIRRNGYVNPNAFPAKSALVTNVARYGSPHLIRPRLGQEAFRALVIEAYERKCAISGETAWPALEAAHIRPYAKDGTHETSNGLLLRRDLHCLYDIQKR